MIVWVHRLLAALGAAQNFNRTIGNDLVGIHVGLRARTSLPHHQRKLAVHFAAGDFVGRFHDRIADFLVQQFEFHVGERGSFFQQAKGVDQRQRHGLAADAEILQAALRLRAPVMVGRHIDRPERVGFGAHVGGFGGGFDHLKTYWQYSAFLVAL